MRDTRYIVMNRFYYDLHIHSCLSPCGDDSSTPDSIAGMGELNGLSIMALTDHNSAKNCPAFLKAAKRHNITAICGMELTTSEDIHVVCLFENLEAAMDFDTEINKLRISYVNKPEIFGNQLIVDDEDNVLATEGNLLINAVMLSLDDAPLLVQKYGGVCYPAHIDKASNSVSSVLGAFPDYLGFQFAEVHDASKLSEYSRFSGLDCNNLLVSSDAHYLWDISEKNSFITLDADENDSEAIVKCLFKKLRGQV